MENCTIYWWYAVARSPFKQWTTCSGRVITQWVAPPPLSALRCKRQQLSSWNHTVFTVIYGYEMMRHHGIYDGNKENKQLHSSACCRRTEGCYESLQTLHLLFTSLLSMFISSQNCPWCSKNQKATTLWAIKQHLSNKTKTLTTNMDFHLCRAEADSHAQHKGNHKVSAY